LPAHLHVDRKIDSRAVAARIDPERVAVVAHRRRLFHELRVGEYHAPRAALGNGEDAKLEAPTALPFEQGGIAPRSRHPDDLVLELLPQLRRGVHDRSAPNGCRPLAIDERALFELTVDLQG
jgi:hypothetical protein